LICKDRKEERKKERNIKIERDRSMEIKNTSAGITLVASVCIHGLHTHLHAHIWLHYVDTQDILPCRASKL